MHSVDIKKATTQLFSIINRVEAGEEFVITRAGKPVARLLGIVATSAAPTRPLGLGRGKFTFPQHFGGLKLDET